MSALAAVKQVDMPDEENRTLCACGCTEQVNPLYDRIRTLRAQRLSFVVIGEMLKIDPRYARMLHRHPPRFIKGHSAQATVWIARLFGHRFVSGGYTSNYCGRCGMPKGGWRR